jgi:hypothetical protein
LTAVTLALAATGCATLNVSSHVQPGLDFAKYRTYAYWQGFRVDHDQVALPDQ